MKCCLPGGSGVFPSQQLFELFPLAGQTIESLLGVIFLYVRAEEEEGEGGGWVAGRGSAVGQRGAREFLAAGALRFWQRRLRWPRQTTLTTGDGSSFWSLRQDFHEMPSPWRGGGCLITHCCERQKNNNKNKKG